MKKSCVVAMAMAAASAWGAGFGLYEMSGKAVMMGGHVAAKAPDASANYYNPGSITSLTGTWITVGFSTLHPTLDTKVDGVNTHKMDSGCFFVPNAFVTQQLPYDFTLGMGFYADYGLASHYHLNWPLSSDSQYSELRGLTFNPNIAYKVTDRWSIGAGLRLMYVSFEQRRQVPTDLSQLGLGQRTMRLKFDVDNDVDVGWMAGTTFKITDNFSLGGVFRSRVRADLKGDSEVRGVPDSYTIHTPYFNKTVQIGSQYRGKIGDKLDIPESITLGAAWDPTEKLHLGASIVWTGWSCVDTIRFNLPVGEQKMVLKWHDTYRTGFGIGYDVTDWWTPAVGYTYDWDPTREKRAFTMLPCGDRHVIAFGSNFKLWDNWELAAAYSVIILESKTMNINDAAGISHRFETDNCFTHCVSVSLSCHF